MIKDIVISILAAGLLAKAPFWSRTGWDLVMGLTIVLFIFLLFLEHLYAEYRKYRYRSKRMRERIERLKNIRLNKQEEEDGIGSGLPH